MEQGGVLWGRQPIRVRAVGLSQGVDVTADKVQPWEAVRAELDALDGAKAGREASGTITPLRHLATGRGTPRTKGDAAWRIWPLA